LTVALSAAGAAVHTILSGYATADGPRLLISVRSPADILRLRGIFGALALGEAAVVRVYEERGVVAVDGVACRCVASEAPSVATVVAIPVQGSGQPDRSEQPGFDW
jgi:hypothetical protein